MRIIFEQSWSDIGKVETTYKEEKTKTSLNFYKAKDHNLILVFVQESMKSLFCGAIMSKLWPILSAKNCTYIGL